MLSMCETFGMDPWQWQGKILSHIFLMNGACEPVVAAKLEAKTRTHKYFSIHLDEYRPPQQVVAITELVRQLPESTASFVLFVSPQIFGSKYRSLLSPSLLLKEDLLLFMVCIDEVHLFLEFGHRFRSEFLQLQHLLFRPLRHHFQPNPNTADNGCSPPTWTTMPVLFMTATADLILMQQVEQITGYIFRQSNLFWPSAIQMTHHHQCLLYTPTTQVSPVLHWLTIGCFKDKSDPDDTTTIIDDATADDNHDAANANTVDATGKKFVAYDNSRLAVDAQSSQRWLVDKQKLLGGAMSPSNIFFSPRAVGDLVRAPTLVGVSRLASWGQLGGTTQPSIICSMF